VTTGPGGFITLSDLVIGQYTITETLKGGWYVTTLNPFNTSVAVNQTTVVYFGNRQSENIPEPAVLVLFAASLAGVGIRRRR